MQRRAFIALIGGAAFGLPFKARAQAQALPTIGFLDSSVATAVKLAAFYAGLKTEGFAKDRNVAVEYIAAAGDNDRLRGLAADLISRKPAVIVAAGVSAALAAKAATSTIPIVFMAKSDPVQAGLISSLNRPGGNLTGVTDMATDRDEKLIALLHEAIPAAGVFGVLVDPSHAAAIGQARAAVVAAGMLGLQVHIVSAKAETDFETAFAALADMRAAGLAIADDDLFISRSAELAALALRHGVAAISQHREFATAGGLMSYGSNVGEIYHQVGAYSGLVLKGAKPADLPVFQSTRVEFFVNLKTAKSLGLNLPPELLGRADAVLP